MKTETNPLPYHPTDAEIRERALELYIRSGWLPGRDLDNWLDAEAFLIAHPPTPPAPVAEPGKVRSHSPRALRRRCA